jgi:hypothetical protein
MGYNVQELSLPAASSPPRFLLVLQKPLFSAQTLQAQRYSPPRPEAFLSSSSHYPTCLVEASTSCNGAHWSILFLVVIDRNLLFARSAHAKGSVPR